MNKSAELEKLGLDKYLFNGTCGFFDSPYHTSSIEQMTITQPNNEMRGLVLARPLAL